MNRQIPVARVDSPSEREYDERPRVYFVRDEALPVPSQPVPSQPDHFWDNVVFQVKFTPIEPDHH